MRNGPEAWKRLVRRLMRQNRRLRWYAAEKERAARTEKARRISEQTGLKQINECFDAILINLINCYGDHMADGHRITIPAVDVRETIARWQLISFSGEDRDIQLIVRKR